MLSVENVNSTVYDRLKALTGVPRNWTLEALSFKPMAHEELDRYGAALKAATRREVVEQARDLLRRTPMLEGALLRVGDPEVFTKRGLLVTREAVTLVYGYPLGTSAYIGFTTRKCNGLIPKELLS